MQCPRCSCEQIRAVATNGGEAHRITRKRSCEGCGHIWYTVEVEVHHALVGWERLSGKGQSKPVLRVPVEIAVGQAAL